MIMTDPRKNFGEARLQNVCPTILSTDYKSPKLVIEMDDSAVLARVPLPLDVSDTFYTVTTRAGNFGVTNILGGRTLSVKWRFGDMVNLYGYNEESKSDKHLPRGNGTYHKGSVLQELSCKLH